MSENYDSNYLAAKREGSSDQDSSTVVLVNNQNGDFDGDEHKDLASDELQESNVTVNVGEFSNEEFSDAQVPASNDHTSIDLENSVTSVLPATSSGSTVLHSDSTNLQEGFVRNDDSVPEQITVIPKEEESNGRLNSLGSVTEKYGFVGSESIDPKQESAISFKGIGISNGEGNLLDQAATENGNSVRDQPLIQEFRSLQPDHERREISQPRASDVDSMDDGNLGENAEKEEAFVDAPDHLASVDRRNSYIGELDVESENRVVMEQLDVRGSLSNLEDQSQIEEEKNLQQLLDEVARLRHELDRTTAEKEHMAHEFGEFKLQAVDVKHSGRTPSLEPELTVAVLNAIGKLGRATESLPSEEANDSSTPSIVSQLSHAVDATIGDLATCSGSLKEEREMFGRELANLHQQLQMLANQQSLLEENSDGLVARLHQAEKNGEDADLVSEMALPMMFDDCSKFSMKLQGALDERIQFEGTIRELHAVLFTKDNEIEDLNAKVAELSQKESYPKGSCCSCVELETKCEELKSEVIQESVAQDVLLSYMGSMHKIWSEQETDVPFKGDTDLEAVSKRIIASLAAVVQQDEVLGDSTLDRMALVEKNITLLVENYTNFLSEIDQLRKCLAEVFFEFKTTEDKEIGVVFDVACKGLLESNRKVSDLQEQLDQFQAFTTKLEEENRRLLEELDKVKESLEEANLNRSELKADLEKAENKWLVTKEKLSMAVTKGKALVQQRDSLRQSLAEKTAKLEECLLELQKKTNDLNVAEASSLNRLDELEVKLSENQNLVVSFQETLLQKSMVLQKIEEISNNGIPEGTKFMEIIDKVGWLANQRNSLEEELSKNQILIASLQESLSQKNTILQKIEDIMSQNAKPEEIESMSITDKVEWLASQRNTLEEEFSRSQNSIISVQESLLKKSKVLQKIEEIMSQLRIPEELQSMETTYKVAWLANQRNSLEEELSRSQNSAISVQESLSQASEVLQKIEQIVAQIGTSEELRCMAITDRVGWLANQRNCLEEELSKSQNLIADLQESLLEKSSVLEKIEESMSQIDTPNELQSMEIIDKVGWLANQRNGLEEELLKSQNSIISVQESLSQDSKILQKIEEIMSQFGSSEELQSLEITDRVGWLANQRNSWEGELLKSQNLITGLQESLLEKSTVLEKIEEFISQIGAPKELQSMEIINKVGWLANQRNILEEELSRSQNSILSVQESFSQESKVLEKIEEIMSQIGTSEELQPMEITDRVGWLANQRNSLVEELSKSQNLIISLQESLLEKRTVLEKIEEITSQSCVPVELQSLEIIDKVGWLANQRNSLAGFLSEYENLHGKLKDTISSIDIPETVSLMELESQINWLGKSFSEAKSNIQKLDEELNHARLAVSSREFELSEAFEEINHLQASLLAEKGEKVFLQTSFENLTSKYEGIVEQASRASSEKDELMKKLLDVAGEALDDQVGDQQSSNASAIPEKLIEKIKEKISAYSLVGTEEFQRLQSFLCERDQELELCKKSLEEASSTETLHKSEITSLTDEVKKLTEELAALKDEKDSMQTDLKWADEKLTLLREKLSMAVKKGKGLVQERENFKVSIEGKNAEIEKLKNELKQHESVIVEFNDQIKTLSSELERVPKLELDIISMKDRKDQVERCLQERDNILQGLMISVESIVPPSNVVFYDPVEKLNWIKEYLLESQAGKNQAEQDLEKAKEEVGLQARELAGARATIKSLEDVLSQAERNVAVLVDEKKEMESRTDHALSALNAKLAVCMEELAGTRCRLENQTSEIANHFNQLQMLRNEGGQMLPLLTKSFSEKFEGIKSVGLILQDIRNQIFQLRDSEWLRGRSLPLQINPGRELGGQKDPYMETLVDIPKVEDHLNGTLVSVTSTTGTVDSLPSHLTDILQGHSIQLKLIGDKFECLSASMDQQIAVLLQVLQITKNEVSQMSEIMESLKLNVNNLEANNRAQENTISTLQQCISILLSACTNATQELQSFEAYSNLLESNSNVECKNTGFSSDGDAEEQREKLCDSKYVKAAENLILEARRVRAQAEQFEKIEALRLRTLDDLQNQLKAIRLTEESAMRDRDLSQNRVSMLEQDLEALESCCNEMKLKLEDYHAKESTLKQKEAELSLLQNTLVAKDQEVNGHFLSEAQIRALFEKVIEIETSSKESGQSHLLSPVDKLFFIVDNVIELQQRMKNSIHEKEELQAILVAQDHEIANLRKESERFISKNEDLEKKSSDLKLGLERIVENLGGYDLLEDEKSIGAKGLLAALENMVKVLVLECESSKSKAQEMDAKFHSSQIVMDELSAKVKLLEDSIRERPIPSDTVLERSIFEAPSLAKGSEISEIEDMGQPVKKPIPTAPIAAHARAMRKGSSDHLALNIDMESDRLINHHESEDKGHVFKSLNTSGLIPKQAKLVADRIDGIWVSGGRILMRRPGARISLIAYWLVLHIWAMASIL